VRTGVPANKVGSEQAIAAYKSRALVERALPMPKGTERAIRSATGKHLKRRKQRGQTPAMRFFHQAPSMKLSRPPKSECNRQPLHSPSVFGVSGSMAKDLRTIPLRATEVPRLFRVVANWIAEHEQ
jgi:hypothetical protein